MKAEIPHKFKDLEMTIQTIRNHAKNMQFKYDSLHHDINGILNQCEYLEHQLSSTFRDLL